MPWARPTLKQLHERAQADISARLLDGAALNPHTVLGVLAAVRAGGEHLQHGFLAWAFKQVFVHQAETEFLEAWAAVWGIRRKAAAPALGRVRLTGTNGTKIAAGLLAKSAGGALYRLAQEALISGAGVEAELEACEPGLSGNLAAGEKLTLVSPVPGLKSELLVTENGITGGADIEPDELLRARLLSHIRQPPHGGNKTDYEQWARELPGVDNALCYPNYCGLGTVAVAVWGPQKAPILPEALVLRVYENILQKCPVTAGPGLYVFAPELVTVDFKIAIMPDTAQVRENACIELADVFARGARPGGIIPRSHLTEALSLAAGEYDHKLYAPLADIMPQKHQLPIMGEIKFIGGPHD